VERIRSVDTTTANVSFANLCIILVNYFLYIYGYPFGNGRRFPFAPLLAAFALLGMLEGVRASSECREWTFKDACQSFGTGRCRLTASSYIMLEKQYTTTCSTRCQYGYASKKRWKMPMAAASWWALSINGK
jgi:hypothetical protein